ncbi:hypothetical protein [Risungbinella massiliensis]|uniref:hypothetical protein n=1 Tax=Risungbinella massiliensis TaxID=1329796 RepID=UPI0005CC7C05|nr:hypothetical protein [Risungbinella massiliensis]
MLKNFHDLVLLFEKAETLERSNVFHIQDMIDFCIDSVEKEIYQSSLKLFVLKDAQIALKTNQPLYFYEFVLFYSHQISLGQPIQLPTSQKKNFHYSSHPKASSTLIKQEGIPKLSNLLNKKQDEFLFYYKQLLEAKKAVVEARKTGQMTEENKLTLKKHVAETLFIFLLVLEDLEAELKSTSSILQGIQFEISHQSVLWVHQMAAGYCKYGKNVPRSFELNKELASNKLSIFSIKDNRIIELNKADLFEKIITMEKAQNKLYHLFKTTKTNKISKAQEYYTDLVLNGDFGLHSLDELFTW